MKLNATLNVLIVSLMLFDISGLYAKHFSEKNIPIQGGGRIKPLDTYARNQTLAFYGKRKINIHYEIPKDYLGVYDPNLHTLHLDKRLKDLRLFNT